MYLSFFFVCLQLSFLSLEPSELKRGEPWANFIAGGCGGMVPNDVAFFCLLDLCLVKWCWDPAIFIAIDKHKIQAFYFSHYFSFCGKNVSR